MGKPKCDPEMYGTNLLKVGHELCPTCNMIVAMTKSVRPLVVMQDGKRTALAELIEHRYYEHKIIPIGDYAIGVVTNAKTEYADLRIGQEKWYDEQVRKGLTDNYEWLSQ